ncbi:MAG: Lipoprotein signal peptidase [Gemmatimonadaceae bacterium]|nr:Lipoprotein signal peptidase [Gemmatimonadaceae bacterium]
MPTSALYFPLAVFVVVVDQITKAIAATALMPRGIPREVFGNAFRWTLVYNPGAAFGLHLGPYSRWIFLVLTLGALVILWRLYRQTPSGAWLRLVAVSLVTGGAVGNLIDRIRSPMGVVDFIDVGIGMARWPTFNVADMAVSTGAFLLAWVLWGEDRAAARASALVQDAEQPTPGTTG